MKLLIDESLPKRLKRELADYKVSTVTEAGWSGKKNGELLKLAQEQFDVFVSADQNLPHQLNLKKFNISVIILVAKTNQIDDLSPLMPKLQKTLKQIKQGDVVLIGS